MRYKIKLLLLPTLLIVACGSQNNTNTQLIHGAEADMARITLLNGKRNGAALIQNPQINFRKYGDYRNGLKEGIWKEERNGRTVRTLEYSKGRFNGKVTEYWPNGNTAHQIDFVNGERKGLEIKYYEDGGLWEKIELSNGKRHGKFERWTRTDTLQNGNYLLGQMCEGNKCGIWTKLYSNGKKCWQVMMKNGLRNGQMEKWDRNGQLIGVQTYKNGVLVNEKIMQ